MLYKVSINGKTYIVEAERAAGLYKNVSRHPLGTLAGGESAMQTVREEAPALPSVLQKKAAPAPAGETPTPVKEAPRPLAADTGSDVVSPMPGTVFDIRAVPGQTVAQGEVILVLEAMKMEIEVVSPADAKVDRILVSKGDPVETGTLLAVLS